MIIFSGHGILIAIFAIAGAAAGHFFSSRIGLDSSQSFVVAVWGAAIAVLLYALTFGKTRSRTLIDPETNRTVEIKKRHTLFFLPAMIWAFALCAVAAFFTFTSITAGPALTAPGPGEKSAGEIAFDAADAKLSSEPSAIQGNSPEAEALAGEMLKSLVELRDAGVSLIDQRALLGDSLKVYCQLSDDGCAFLIMESGLEKYAADGREILSKAAWMSASTSAQNLAAPPVQLAIGIRGPDRYHAAGLGERNADFSDIVKYQGEVDRRALYPFFGAVKAGDEAEPPSPQVPSPATPGDDATPSPGPTPDSQPPRPLNSTATPAATSGSRTPPPADSSVPRPPLLDLKLVGGDMILSGRLRSEYQIKDILAALERSRFALTSDLSADADTRRVDWGNRIGPLLTDLADSVPDLHFRISDGEITITGTVKDAAEKSRLQRAMSYVFETSMDITALNNELQEP